MERTKLSMRVLPSYTKGEEIFNMISHIVGGALGRVDGHDAAANFGGNDHIIGGQFVGQFL